MPQLLLLLHISFFSISISQCQSYKKKLLFFFLLNIGLYRIFYNSIFTTHEIFFSFLFQEKEKDAALME